MKKIKLKTKLNLFVTTLLFFFINISCSHKYYAPNDGDILVLRKKNDVHISGGGQNVISGENTVTRNAQIGYSPISHLAITGSYFDLKIEDENTPKGGNGYIWSGAIGGYYFFQQNKNSKLPHKKFLFYDGPMKMEKGILIDLYLGISDGFVFNHYKNGGESQFKFRKPYGQFGLHFIRPNWGLDYTVRLGSVNYYQGVAYGEILPKNKEEIDALEFKNSYRISEISIRVHFGIRPIRYFISTTGVLESSEINELQIYSGNGSFGLIIEIDEFFRKYKKDQISEEKVF